MGFLHGFPDYREWLRVWIRLPLSATTAMSEAVEVLRPQSRFADRPSSGLLRSELSAS